MACYHAIPPHQRQPGHQAKHSVMLEDYQPRKALNVLLNLLRHQPYNIAVLHKVLGIASNSKAQHCNIVQLLVLVFSTTS